MRKYLLKKDHHDERDYEYLTHEGVLPPKVDLVNQYMPPIYDQGNLGSCTANALVGLREYWNLENSNTTHLSRLYLYWHERYLEGSVSEDAGASLRDGMKVLKNIGCCPEVDFPYNVAAFTHTPTTKAEADAGTYKIGKYHRVRNLHTLKEALASGLPVAFGIEVYESFESPAADKTGVIPMPAHGEKLLGGHALLAVGYSDVDGHVKFRNSWGAGWGDQGYGYLPYAYFGQYVMDMWMGK